MKQITAIGIAGAIVALLIAVVLEGGNPMGLFNIPALVIVVGGTAGVSFASTKMERIRTIPKLYGIAIKGSPLEPRAAVQQMVGLAEKARREGLLSLESELPAIDDAYTRKGVQLVVDGTDSELVGNILEAEIDGMSKRHADNAKLFATAGGFAPTLGIIGTVLSLVAVLENLANPAMLGEKIAGAFLATLYGVGSANLIFLPVANKLKEISAEEVNYRYMLLDAVLAIQAGENPRMLGERLEAYLPPDARGAPAEPAKEAAPAAPPAEEQVAA